MYVYTYIYIYMCLHAGIYFSMYIHVYRCRYNIYIYEVEIRFWMLDVSF